MCFIEILNVIKNILTSIRLFLSELMSPNMITILSIVASGMVSWVISAIYFRKSNRESLKNSVLLPITLILSKPVSRNNFAEIKEISKNYFTKYLSKKEKRSFIKVINEYGFVCGYNESLANATAVLLDYEIRLKRNRINPKIVPINLNDEVTEYDYPDDINYLHMDIGKVFDENCLETETKLCLEKILSLLKGFTKKFYTNDVDSIFADYNLITIIKNSTITDKWNWKFDKYKIAKQNFEELRIVKSIKITFNID